MTVYRLGAHRPELPEAGRFWIAPTAAVIGRVRLGDEVSVWFGATLRADNEPIELGARTNVQEKATLHVDPGFPIRTGAGCTIGHNAILHGCMLGENCLIGMGATVLNGARLGANCLVGANALVTEGKEFPAGSLIVGAPARVVRPLSGEEIAGLTRAAEGYLLQWRRYARDLAVEAPEGVTS